MANRTIGVRVSEDERAALDERAKREGKTLSEVLKGMIAGDDSTRMESNGEASGEGLRELPVGDLAPSRTAAQAGRRARMSDEGLDELAESIRGIGVVQPLVVRPRALAAANAIPAPDEPWEIVAGERRWLAAKRAGLATVPCVVREWDDERTLQAQIIENLQREDTHMLDEALGYEQLAAYGWSKARIAKETGRSESYVFARFRLLTLCGEARDAFAAGRVNGTVALLLATVPAAMQPKALALVDPHSTYRPLTTREAQAQIDQHLRRRLDEAPFGAHAQLGGKPPCAKCPLNSTVDRSLAHKKRICTDPGCYAAKCAAHVADEVARRAAGGATAIEKPRRDDYEYNSPSRRRYVVEGDVEAREVLGLAKRQGVELQPLLLPPADPESGREVSTVYLRDEVERLVKRPKPKPDPWERERDRRARRNRVDAAHRFLRSRLGRPAADPAALAVVRLLVGSMAARAPASVNKEIEREWFPDDVQDRRGHALADACPPASLLAMGVDLAAADMSEWNDTSLEGLERAAAVFGFERGAKKGRAKRSNGRAKA